MGLTKISVAKEYMKDHNKKAKQKKTNTAFTK